MVDRYGRKKEAGGAPAHQNAHVGLCPVDASPSGAVTG
jgi:hypothetical protein